MTASQQGKIDNKNKPGRIVSEGVKCRQGGESGGEGLGEVGRSPLQGGHGVFTANVTVVQRPDI